MGLNALMVDGTMKMEEEEGREKWTGVKYCD